MSILFGVLQKPYGEHWNELKGFRVVQACQIIIIDLEEKQCTTQVHLEFLQPNARDNLYANFNN